jgi:dihydroflavonol-4-reductase
VKAFVTGAAGFIGSHVVRALVGDGHAVRALHLPGEDTRNLRGLDVERIAGDVTDRAAMQRAMRGCDWVFHLAAVYTLWERIPGRMQRVNVEGTRTVLDVAREVGVARVIHTSSIARFGGQGPGARATEESDFRLGETEDAYSRTKADAHAIAIAAARAGQDVTICAPTGPVGPGDVGPTPTGRLLLRCLTLPALFVTKSAVNFADVRDIARGHVLAAERGKKGETYLLGHRDVELPELARMVLRITGLQRPILVVPFAAARVAAHGALWLSNHVTLRAPLITPQAVAISALGLTADCSKAVRELGLPQTPIETALTDALEWFAREGYVKNARIQPRAAVTAGS